MKNIPALVPSSSRVRWPMLTAAVNRICLTGAVALLVPVNPGQSQPPNSVATRPTAATTGSISGRVQNEITGQYLSNARVTVKGTNLTAFTDEFGIYRISRVSSGPVVVEVLYSGLVPGQAAVTIPAGGGVEQDFSLTNPGRYGDKAAVVKLDPFVIASSRVTEGDGLATNEQRFAPNLKNVVATDTFGDVTEGNIGEFMKFIPGIVMRYEGAAPVAAGVRGFDANLTSVMIDGAQLANAVEDGASREFQFKQVSINNTSRIEVTKVPTPANPADAMGGAINMVSKSAFERSRAQFNYRLYLSANSKEITLRQTPDPHEKYTYKILPGFDFDYTLPLGPNFGIVLTALSSAQFVGADNSSKTYNAGGTGTGATPARPYLQSYQLIDGPKRLLRDSISLRADWRISPNSVLTFSGQNTWYHDEYTNDNITFNVGTIGTPTVANGVGMTFDDDTTVGATGRGSVVLNNNFFFISGVTVAGNTRYRFENGDWRIDGGITHSLSKTWRRCTSEGSFQRLVTAMLNPVRVTFDDIRADRPGTVRVFDNSNREVDYRDLRNYRLTGAAGALVADVRETIVTGDFNVRRNLSFLPFPVSVQVGGLQRIQTRDSTQEKPNWTYNSPNGDVTPAPFKAQIFGNQKNFFGFDNLPWLSPRLAFQAWEKNPALFTKTLAQQVTEARNRVNDSQYIRETVSALYLQAEGRFLHNRLRVLTGVRYERTADDAKGPLFDNSAIWVRNANGTFAHNAAGARIRRPEAGAAGSMEELLLIARERGYQARRDYDGAYPSLHFTFNATEKLLLRAAFARTYGRPDFNSVIPNSTIDENDVEGNDPSVVGGNITIRNTGLKPWTANNYDLSVEYYTEQGGFFSAGVFRKDIRNFFGDFVKIATAADLAELGLDPRYAGWRITTKFNAGDAHVTGAEAGVQQALTGLRDWGRYFRIFANVTKLKLEGNQNASFSGFMPFNLNWGVTFTKNPVTIMAKWYHRGEQRTTAIPAMGPDAYLYNDSSTSVDLNVTWQLGKRISIFGNARNLQNTPQNQSRAGSETPEYARHNRPIYYGAQYAVGIKGTF